MVGGLVALVVAGGVAVDRTGSVPDDGQREASTGLSTTNAQIEAMDAAWNSPKGADTICPLYQDMQGNLSQDRIESMIVSNYETGWRNGGGAPLTKAAKDHLVALVEAC
jgi:hypothetical protein